RGQNPLPLEPFTERLAIDIFHYQVGKGKAGRVPDLVNGDDVIVLDSRRLAVFVGKAGVLARAGGQPRLEDLDGDQAVQGVIGLEHHAKLARTHFLADVKRLQRT